MLILNTGGTFNKRYNPIDGELEVPFDNDAIESILESCHFDYALAGVVYKDSLEMDANDRKTLARIIGESNEKSFLIVHGTDSMHESAEFLAEVFDDKKIVFTGAMKPYEINKVEASVNLAMSIGYLKALHNDGVYICMNGNVELWNNIRKNKEQGRFELVQ